MIISKPTPKGVRSIAPGRVVRPVNMLAVGLALAIGAGYGSLNAQTNAVADMIQTALAAKAFEVTIPPGTYRITGGNHFELRGVRNFTIHAYGVKLIFTTRKTALNLFDCENVEIRGWTMDYDPLPFTQGTIIANGPGWSYTDVELHKGYPDALPSGARIEVKDRDTRLLKPDLYMIYGTQVEMLRPGVLRVHNTGSFNGKVRLGDFLVDHYPDQGGYHGIEMVSCRKMTFRDITFHSSPGYALHSYGCSGTRMYRFLFTPGPMPAGADQPRLRTGHADGLHFENDRVGPYIEESLIEANGDDGIAIHGDMAKFAATVSGNATVRIDTMKYLHLVAGDTLVGLTAQKGIAFTAKVLSFAGDAVILDRPVDAEKGAFVYNWNASGNGYVLRNNITRNHRARGFLVRGANGIIEGNTIDWTQEAGIGMFPEWENWTQGGLARGVRIYNNTIRRAALMSHTRAVDISVPTSPAAGAMRDIVFRNNTVDSCPGANLWVGSAQGVSILGNRFLNAAATTRDIATLDHSDSATVKGNCVEGAAPAKALKILNSTGVTLEGAFMTCDPTTFPRDAGRTQSERPGIREFLWTGTNASILLPQGSYRATVMDPQGKVLVRLLNGAWGGGRFPATGFDALECLPTVGALILHIEPIP
jgi:hypothetical protein